MSAIINCFACQLRHSVLRFYCFSTTVKSIDPIQQSYLNESCILVDQCDRTIGSASKYDCHQWSTIRNRGGLHRAFSLFLFNSKKELLLQKRANTKLTFPGVWTNTVCSHPLADIRNEMLLDPPGYGAKCAALRKLNHELGLQLSSIDRLHYLTRIHYRAQCLSQNGTWGEHEVDYCLAAQIDDTELVLNINGNEVSETAFVSANNLQLWLKDTAKLFSPWFLLIAKEYLPNWWQHLDDLRLCYDHHTIHCLA